MRNRPKYQTSDLPPPAYEEECPPPSYEEVYGNMDALEHEYQAWVRSQNDAERAKILKQYPLAATFVEKGIYPVTHGEKTTRISSEDYWLRYHYCCACNHYPSAFGRYRYYPDISPIIIINPPYYGQGGGRGSNHHGKSTVDDKNKSSAGAIVALIALIAGAIALGSYGIKKIWNSTSNLFQQRKVGKSVWRLATISAGIGTGLLKGVAIGAAIGSAIPGIGTAAGAVIGLVCCPLIGAGLGALIGKYTAKAFSWFTHRNDKNAVSKSCPEKYTLPADVKKHLREESGLDEMSQTRMLKKLREQKNRIGLWGSVPHTSSREMKDKANTILQKIRTDVPPTVNGGLYIWKLKTSGNEALAWDNQAQVWKEGNLTF